MRQSLTLRVEIFDKAEGTQCRSMLWHILPEYVTSNVKGAAVRCECMVKSYLTVEGNDVPANRQPYFDFDGALQTRDPQAWVEYEGVRHFDQVSE